MSNLPLGPEPKKVEGRPLVQRPESHVLSMVYVHDCPKDYDLYLCPVEGEQVVVRPQVEGSAYLATTPRCVYTTAELRLIGVDR